MWLHGDYSGVTLMWRTIHAACSATCQRGNRLLERRQARLSGLTKQARDGMRVVITNHGTPIADLVSHGASAMAMRTLKRPGRYPSW